MSVLFTLVALLLSGVTVMTMVVLAKRRRTLPVTMTVGLFAVGLSSLLLSIALFEDEPCTYIQLLLRASSLGFGLLLMMWSMMRSRADGARHDDDLQLDVLRMRGEK